MISFLYSSLDYYSLSIQASEKDVERQECARQLRLKLTNKEMIHEDGTLNNE